MSRLRACGQAGGEGRGRKRLLGPGSHHPPPGRGMQALLQSGGRR